VSDGEIILSHSSIAEYWKCHHRYYLNSVLRLPGVGNLAMALGTAVHAAAEAIYTSPLKPLAVLRRSFAAETAGLPAQEMSDDPGALGDGETMLATYQREVVPTFHPTMNERAFTVRAEEVLLTGIIDAADDEDVHDTKTTSLISKFHPESYQVQMTIYHWGYTAITGHAPKRLLLDVLPRGGKVRYRQVEVKPAHGEVRDLVRLTAHGIMQRDWTPTGALSGACAYCPFRTSCEFSNV